MSGTKRWHGTEFLDTSPISRPDGDKAGVFLQWDRQGETPGTWGQPSIFIPIYFTTISHPPMRGSPDMLFLQLHERTPFPGATLGGILLMDMQNELRSGTDVHRHSSKLWQLDVEMLCGKDRCW